MKTLWFVTHGNDLSHMWDSKHFHRLKDAKEFARNLPPTPAGGKQPYIIEKYSYSKCEVYGDIVQTTEVVRSLG